MHEPPRAADPERPLRRAAPCLVAHVAYLRAGADPPAPLGDLGAHARVVLSVLPELADLLLGPAPAMAETAAPAPALPEPAAPPSPDILLGTSGTVVQHGLLGRTVPPGGDSSGPGSEPVHLDTNGCELCVITGDIGSGKSSTLGVCIENAVLKLPGLNVLKKPLCVVVLVLHNDNHELLESVAPNRDPRAVRALLEVHRASPAGLPALRRLVLPALLGDSQAAFPHIPVSPLRFPPGRLDARSWELLLGLEEHPDTLYAQLVFGLLAELRDRVTLAGLRQAAAARKMPSQTRVVLASHLDLGAAFIADEAPEEELVAPGAVLVAEVRDRYLRPEQRAVVAAVLIEQLHKEARRRGCHLLLCFEEAHNVLGSRPLLRQLDGLVRERRHLDLSLCVVDQDLLRLPLPLLSQASVVVAHRSVGERKLRHLCQADPRWRQVDPHRLAALPAGRAYVLAAGGVLHPEVEHFLSRPRLLDIRDRVSQHGGATRTAVPG